MRKPSLQGAYSQLGSQILNRDHPVRRGHAEAHLRAEGEDAENSASGGGRRLLLQGEELGLGTNPQVGVGLREVNTDRGLQEGDSIANQRTASRSGWWEYKV